MNDAITVPPPLLERLANILERIESRLGPSLEGKPGDLLSYAQVAQRLGKGGKPLSRRQVERLQAKYPRLLKKVKTGNRTVGFRPADVERLISFLAGDSIGERRL